jgi:hypothetical protein
VGVIGEDDRILQRGFETGAFTQNKVLDVPVLALVEPQRYFAGFVKDIRCCRFLQMEESIA